MKNKIYLISSLLFLGLMLSCSDDEQDSSVNQEEDSVSVMAEYSLNSTGQTKLYDKDGNEVSNLSESDDCYGQDGNYQKGLDMSFTDQGDVIIDNNTSLMWQKVPSSESFTWDEAKEYCENLDLGGYTDWRMPSTKELYSISNFEEGWPYIDKTYFILAQTELTKDEQYWSSELYVGQATEQSIGALLGQETDSISNNGQMLSPPPMGSGQTTQPNIGESTDLEAGEYAQKAFGVNYATGHIKAYAANAGGPIGGNYIRAVRGNKYGVNNFTDNGDETISDLSTGLMWSKNDSGTGMEWEESLSYAQNSTLAGYNDWRLPNVKELQNIVDYDYSPSAEDEASKGPAIDKIFNCTQIINEAGYNDYAYYWTGTSARFQKDGPMYYAWYVAFGRAVDGDGEDLHGAGAVRFDVKYNSGVKGEDGERYTNYVRLVRNID